ncbi:MAG: aspartate carbamoyltransferase, partial [Candidatus Bipolaricaulia bacterium]
LGRIDGLKIGMVGDLRYGRTVHSLAQALTRFDDVSLRLMSPPTLQIPDGVRRELDGELAFEEIDDLAVEDLDVVYVTRIQRERFPDVEEYDKVQGTYVVTPETADSMREDAIILHPLPRVDEIEPTVDDKPQAKYFEQARGGVPVRMALLKLLLRGPDGGQN